NLMPDLDKLTRYIRESANELEEAVQQKMKETAALKKLLEQD
ncbi:MAG: diacylglycerol O-acyltransferase, partial [Paraglaciecola sp.]